MPVTVKIKTNLRIDKMIAKGQRKKRRSLYRFGFIGRSALREVVRTRKGNSKPGQAPSDHGFYRKTALFMVKESSETVLIGFPIKRKGSSLRGGFKENRPIILSHKAAQDTLEFGGRLMKRYKSGTNQIIEVKPRPHVFVAQERLARGKGSAGRAFQRTIKEQARAYIL